MGANLSGLYTKQQSNLLEECKPLTERLDDEQLLSKFEEITQNLEIAELENNFGAFQFVYNYYLEFDGGINRVEINYEEESEGMRHTVVSPLLGKDERGTWVYIGECLMNTKLRDGRGFLVYIEGKSKFQGYFRHDKINGRGRLSSTEKVVEGD